MARQVFYDPFGMRVAGYQQGLQDEMRMQAGTRQARASDYDFDVLQPMRTRQVQRDDEFGAAYQPYRLQEPGLAAMIHQANAYNAVSPIAREYGAITGRSDPFLGMQRALLTGGFGDYARYGPAANYYEYGQLFPDDLRVPQLGATAGSFGVDESGLAQFLFRNGALPMTQQQLQSGREFIEEPYIQSALKSALDAYGAQSYRLQAESPYYRQQQQEQQGSGDIFGDEWNPD